VAGWTSGIGGDGDRRGGDGQATRLLISMVGDASKKAHRLGEVLEVRAMFNALISIVTSISSSNPKSVMSSLNESSMVGNTTLWSDRWLGSMTLCKVGGWMMNEMQAPTLVGCCSASTRILAGKYHCPFRASILPFSHSTWACCVERKLVRRMM
jgi:hypothetical protein